MRTDILKKYPYPVFENERFLSEVIVTGEIAKKYGAYLMENETERSDASMKQRIAIVASIAERPEQVGAVLMEGLNNNHFEGGSVRYLTLKDGAVDFIFNTNADGLPLLSPGHVVSSLSLVEEHARETRA